MHELVQRGFKIEAQRRMVVQYKGIVVGEYIADIVVESCMPIELKCCEALAPERVAQCINYLKASGIRAGFLVNFQQPRVEFKRIVR